MNSHQQSHPFESAIEDPQADLQPAEDTNKPTLGDQLELATQAIRKGNTNFSSLRPSNYEKHEPTQFQQSGHGQLPPPQFFDKNLPKQQIPFGNHRDASMTSHQADKGQEVSCDINLQDKNEALERDSLPIDVSQMNSLAQEPNSIDQICEKNSQAREKLIGAMLEGKQVEDYLAQEKQLTVGLIQPYAPDTQPQPQTSQLDTQAIEKRLLDQDNQSMLDSNTTSNLNQDSATIREKETLAKQIKNGDPFQNFDYDKNQSKSKEDESYPEPPSFLLNVNNKTLQESQSQNKLMLDPAGQLSGLQPEIQNSSQVDDIDLRAGSNRPPAGLPQPYEPTVYYDFKDFPDLKWEPFKDQEACPPSSYFDARNFENNGDKMENLLKGGTSKPILFDLQNTWLKGEQYAHILQNQDRYCQTFGIQKYDYKQHPESIYIDPKDGLLYFVQGESIGSDFGFPRLGIRKRFKWKKMNFTTDLPKRDPLVSYIVASAVKCEKFFPGSNDDGPVYRMHAVILKKRDTTLQLPNQLGTSSLPSLKKTDQQQSQDTNSQLEHADDQQPRSKHGRVLTKSTKLKAAQINSGPNAKKNVGPLAGGPQSISPKDEQPFKNYILCHVRRVMGKRDEEFESEAGAGDEVQQKRDNSQVQVDAQKQQCSKIPNKGKNKFDHIPLRFSHDAVSPGKDKKIPNPRLFEGLSYDQIRKMKVGPDGKTLSAYKIKKYILPYTKANADVSSSQPLNASAYSVQQQDDDEHQSCNELEDRSQDKRLSEDNNSKEVTQLHQIQQSTGRGRKRKNPQPVSDLENEITAVAGSQVRAKKIQNFESKTNNEGEKSEQIAELGDLNEKKKINIEMVDEEKTNKGTNLMKHETECQLDKKEDVGELDSREHNKQTLHAQNERAVNPKIDEQPHTQPEAIGGLGCNTAGANSSSFPQNNFGSQGQFNIDQALALSLLNGGNNFGLNNLGLQNTFSGVNGFMFNQINALQSLNAQQQNNINSFLGTNSNTLSLNDLQFQNQLLGFQNSLGLNNFGGYYGLNNINNLLGMNQLQNLNLNNLLGQTPLGSLSALQLQQQLNLLNQGGASNQQLLSQLQEQLKLKNWNLDNNLLMMNQQNNERLTGNGNDASLNVNDLINASLLTRQKDQKSKPQKFEPMKQLEQLKNSALSPHLLHKDMFSNNGISPQLKNFNMGALGPANAFLSAGNIGQGSQKRKQTLDNNYPFLEDLSNDLWKQCLNEQTRRHSGQMKFPPDDQKSQNVSPKSHNISAFNKSPNIPPTAQKLADQLNSQINNVNRRKKSTVSNFGRDRLNSNFSAFKKYDQRNNKDKDVTTSPLIEGKQGEPSFGPDSIHDSKSIATLRAPKNSGEGSTMQNISKKNDSNSVSQNNLKAAKQQNVSNVPDQQSLLQHFGQLNDGAGNSGGGTNNANFNFLNPGLANEANNNNSGAGQQQGKGGGSQQAVVQQQWFQQYLYHVQQSQMLQKQLALTNPNLLPFDLLSQSQQPFNGQNQGGQLEKTESKQSANHTQNKRASESQLKSNPSLNVFETNTLMQPVLGGIIVNQFSNNNGYEKSFQNRKDSIRGGSKNTGTAQSPNIGGGRQFGRSRGSSLADHQFINRIKHALAANPTSNQPQEGASRGLAGQTGGSMLIAPQKQDSHRNSNVSQHNLFNFAARKSTDMTPPGNNKHHKYSITGAVINCNPPSFQQQPHLGNAQKQMRLSSQQPSTQENQHQAIASPSRHLDSSASYKQESIAKMPQHPLANHELMKSPGLPVANARSLAAGRRKQSSNFDVLSKNTGQQQPLFRQPASRQSGQIQLGSFSGMAQQNAADPGSGANFSDEAHQKGQTANNTAKHL